MTISLIINTCCLGPRAEAVLSSGKQPHNLREFLLKCFIIPKAIESPAIDEIIVVGEYEPGEGYTYVHSPSVYFNCRDALHQRQAGFEASHGDVLLFQHDDHLVTGSLPPASAFLGPENVGVVVPERQTRMRLWTGEQLPSGQGLYIMGHAACYLREVLERCPWGDVLKYFDWDRAQTHQIRQAGYAIAWTDRLIAWDIEMGSKPWE